MNTTEKGDEFEDRVYSLLPRMIAENDLPVPIFHKIFKKKKYLTDDFEVNADISIEVYSKSHPDNPSQIIIIECKNLSAKLDISDYQEWLSKIAEMRKSGIKLYFAVKSGYPESVRESAKKKGVGLIVFGNSEEWDILVPRRVLHSLQYKEQFWDMSSSRVKRGCPIVFQDNKYLSLSDVIREWGLVPVEDKISIPYISEDKIEAIVEILRSRIPDEYRDIPEYGLWLPLYTSMKIVDDYPSDFLGGYNCINNTILVAHSLLNELGVPSPRMRFTMAHELGHCALHRKYLRQHFNMLVENQIGDVFFDSEKDAYDRMEWQANTFASYLLMPREAFLKKVNELFKRYDIRLGKLRLDKQRCNIVDCNKVLKGLADSFNVSKEAAKIRLQKLGLLDIADDIISFNSPSPLSFDKRQSGEPLRIDHIDLF